MNGIANRRPDAAFVETNVKILLCFVICPAAKTPLRKVFASKTDFLKKSLCF